MEYKRIDVSAGMVTEIPTAFVPTLAYTIGKDGEEPQIFQWHVFDQPGWVPLSDDPSSENFWQTVAQRHLDLILAEPPVPDAPEPEA